MNPFGPERGKEIRGRVMDAIHTRVIGQDVLIERMLVGLFTGGHILLEGAPGLAKTLMVKSIADALDISFQRIQFTPDLLPADVVGTMIYNQKTGDFVARPGPNLCEHHSGRRNQSGTGQGSVGTS